MTLRVAKEIAASGRWLRPLREAWPRAVCSLLEQGEPAVVKVLVAQVRGSAPREPGTCMLVVHGDTYGTIGGGNLEWQASRAAHSLLETRSGVKLQVLRLVLGRELGQCCGGVVELRLERFTADDLPVLRSASLQESTRLRSARMWLYGAGHVAQALINILAELPFEVNWIDSRAELLPTPLPDNIHSLCIQAPINTVSTAPAGTRFLVMTHDHALDYALCRRILERNDFAWLGLIGSKSKGARFRSRLAKDGVAPEAIARLTCPIGVEGLTSKLPAAIAVAVAAQLLQGLALTPAATAIADSCSASDCAACCSAQARGEEHGEP